MQEISERQEIDEIVDFLQAYYQRQLAGAENSMASDIYGGVTNNFISGTYGHTDTSKGFYWYDTPFLSSKLELNGDLLTNEFFAEGLSTMLVGPDDMVKSAQKFFPSAMPELTSILSTTVI